VHFIMLDTYEEGASWANNFTTEHLAWLEADLAANSAQKFKIGFMHPKALNGHGVEDDLRRLAGQYNISLFLSGHEHYYYHRTINNGRFDEHYVIQGIGGNANNDYRDRECSTAFTRITVSATEMRVEVRWINGTTLDQYTILPP
jgi:3',5'-cyclic AMP phosphodiesterase CpdA